MLIPGAESQTATNSSGWGYGKGFRRIPLTTLKMAVFAPMPTANVRVATALNRGARPKLRRTCQSWILTHGIRSHLPDDVAFQRTRTDIVRADLWNVITSARLLKF